jgi:hypothetical protein
VITIETLDLGRVLYVCKNMRIRDWNEVSNLLRAGATPDVIAMGVMASSSFGFVACYRDIPVTVVQFAEILDGTWRVGLFSTDEFPRVARAVVREIRTVAIPHMLDLGAQYCEAYADAGHAEAHRLLQFMGMTQRATLERYGSKGRDIALFVRTRKDSDDVLCSTEPGLHRPNA